MNGSIRRASSLTVAVAAAALTLTGCSVGQISQVATQQAAVNGVAGTAGNIALRNVHLRAAQSLDYVQPPTEVELLLVAANLSPDVNDRLVGITSDVGDVQITGERDVLANKMLIIGQPDGVPDGIESPTEGASIAKATVTLNKPISNGLTYEFVFDFEQAGSTTVRVPIDAGLQDRREESGTAAEGSGEHH